MTSTDKIILYVLLGGFIVLQLYWMYTNPRSLKEKFIFYLGLKKKNRFSRYVVFITMALVFFLSFFPESTKPFFQLTHMSYDSLFSMLGIMIYIFGYVIALWARIIMQEKWLPAGDGHNEKKQNKLFMSGPFQFTRNPIYVGIIAVYLGFFIALRSPLVILVLLPAIFFYQSAVQEEGYLEKQFGKKYLPYKKSVPRFLFK